MSQSEATTSAPQLSLTDHLINRIRREGPITFREWMREALYNDAAGYYTRPGATIWGRTGDYRTSPERSGLFAATFARFFTELYEHLDRPQHFKIVECGAGDGSFAEGALQSLRAYFPDVYSAIAYFVGEVSPRRLNDLKQRLGKFGAKVEFVNHDNVCELDPGIVFSNELLDSFPVNLITKHDGELIELYVGFNDSSGFDWVSGPLSSKALREMYEEIGTEIGEDQIIELSLDIDEWMKMVASKLRKGYVVTVDYGAEAKDLYENPDRLQGTVRAYARHKFVDVLTNPGDHDITAHVNWTRVQSVGSALGLKSVRFQQQDKFLLAAGLLSELERRLATAPDEAEKTRLTTAAREMVLPNGMAASFQVLVQEK
ncbi:MAG TPA: SAM-dependent methyltransferase [Pyrinomonadaceae bacterium]|nr:SAM-dependent methyltransferase [Pyrinomonadaceae bacterium]